MDARTPKQRLLAARLVWVGFAVSPALYIFIAHLLAPSVEPPWEGESSHTLMRIVMAAMAVTCLVAQQVLHVAILGPRIAQESDAEKRAGLALSEMVIRSAFLESIVIFGLVLMFLYGRLLDPVAFGAASLMVMPLTFPLASSFDPASSSGGPWYASGDR